MNKIFSLANIQANKNCKIISVEGGYGIIKRLDAMGIKEGKIIRKISSQPMRGPVLLEINGSQIAIGYGMAGKIIVEEEE